MSAASYTLYCHACAAPARFRAHYDDDPAGVAALVCSERLEHVHEALASQQQQLIGPKRSDADQEVRRKYGAAPKAALSDVRVPTDDWALPPPRERRVHVLELTCEQSRFFQLLMLTHFMQRFRDDDLVYCMLPAADDLYDDLDDTDDDTDDGGALDAETLDDIHLPKIDITVRTQVYIQDNRVHTKLLRVNVNADIASHDEWLALWTRFMQRTARFGVLIVYLEYVQYANVSEPGMPPLSDTANLDDASVAKLVNHDAHAAMLLHDRVRAPDELLFLEPNGALANDDELPFAMRTILARLQADDARALLFPGIERVLAPADNAALMRGPQAWTGMEPTLLDGFCVVLSMFWLHAILLNPQHSLHAITTALYDTTSRWRTAGGERYQQYMLREMRTLMTHEAGLDDAQVDTYIERRTFDSKAQAISVKLALMARVDRLQQQQAHSQ